MCVALQIRKTPGVLPTTHRHLICNVALLTVDPVCKIPFSTEWVTPPEHTNIYTTQRRQFGMRFNKISMLDLTESEYMGPLC